MMKSCPHCKAKLENEARFCLYCMTSLETKQTIIAPDRKPRKAPVRIAVVAAFIALLTAVLAIWRPWVSTTQVSSPNISTSTTAENTTSQESMSAEAPVYRYRTAELGRDYYASADINIPDDAIVVTGVLTPSADGIYTIPDSIDGHRVITVAGLAFSDEAIRDTVKTVIFSASVRTVEDHAFAACSRLSDVYFCGDTIYASTYAFPDPSELEGTLTIHCSATCSDGRFRYYKDKTTYAYEEWNGGDLL